MDCDDSVLTKLRTSYISTVLMKKKPIASTTRKRDMNGSSFRCQRARSRSSAFLEAAYIRDRVVIAMWSHQRYTLQVTARPEEEISPV